MSILPKPTSAPPPPLQSRNVVKARAAKAPKQPTPWTRLARQLPPAARSVVDKYLQAYPSQSGLACETLEDPNNRHLFVEGFYHCANGDLDQLLEAIDGERLKDGNRKGITPKAATSNPFATMIALGHYVERLRSVVERGETSMLLAVFENYQDRKIASSLLLPNGINKNRQAHILERIFAGIGPQAIFSLLVVINCLQEAGSPKKSGSAQKLASRCIGAIARSEHGQGTFNILLHSLEQKTARRQVGPNNLANTIEIGLFQELANPLFFPLLHYLNQTDDQAPTRPVLGPIVQRIIIAKLHQPETIGPLMAFLEANPDTIDKVTAEFVEATSRAIRTSVLPGMEQLQDNLEYLNGTGKVVDNKETVALVVRLSAWSKQLTKLRTEEDVAKTATALRQMLPLTAYAKLFSSATKDLLTGYQLVMTSALPQKGARVTQAVLEYQSETLVCGFLMKEVEGNLLNANRLRSFLKGKEIWPRIVETMGQRKEEALALFINNLVFEAKKRAGYIHFPGKQLIAVKDPFQLKILEEALNNTLHLLG